MGCLVNMVTSKRAQIFLLAAVIVSAIVLSLGIAANQAKITDEPKRFYDYSYEVQREVGAIMDYEIYTNFSEGDNLDEFVNVLSENIQDSDTDETFMFIYGNNKKLTLLTYNPQEKSEIGSISVGSFYKNINKNKVSKEILEEELEGAEEVKVEFEDSEVSVKLSKHRQVIFIIKKDINDEIFIAKG